MQLATALRDGCPHLEALSLELTPVSKLPFYRAHVLARMPQLRSLDGTPVHPREVEAAPGMVRRDVGGAVWSIHTTRFRSTLRLD